jgi:hypothetical protein
MLISLNIYLYFLLFRKFFHIFRPDTFVYTTADQSGFLLPQLGAYFVLKSEG